VNELRNLWHFVQVAQAGSFTIAASRLALSTPALSKSVARLERRIGTRLFVRTSRTLHLTDEGRALFERVSDSFGEIENSFNVLGDTGAVPAGVVRLSTVTAYGKHCVLPLLPDFLARYPQVDVVMSFHDGQRGMTRQAFDVRINWGESYEQNKVSHTLCRMPLILVGSPHYLSRRGTPLRPEDLEHHDCINVTLANGVRGHWTFVARRTGRGTQRVTIAPKGRLIVMDELDAVADAAIAGLGLTVSSMENVLGSLRDGTLVHVLPDYDVLGNDLMASEIVIQYARRKSLPPRVCALVEFLLERLKGRDPLSIVTSSEVAGSQRLQTRPLARRQLEGRSVTGLRGGAKPG
jgi:DNA-binding transcriptional LysR family regulator